MIASLINFCDWAGLTFVWLTVKRLLKDQYGSTTTP